MGTVVQDATPPEAVVAVVSKGDPRLVELEERTGLHFPADAEGRYAGYYPRTGEEAIAQLEAARNAGAEYLCLPATAFWWLEHYAGLAAWLGVHCRVAAEDRQTCIVYDLLRSPQETAADGSAPDRQLRALVAAILPADAVLFTVGIEAEALAGGGRTVSSLGRGNPLGLQRRLQRAGGPCFVLVGRRQSDPAPDPGLDSLFRAGARLLASRPGLCDLYALESPANAGRLSQSSREEDQLPRSGSSLDGEGADKLTKRLERLGLAGHDGDSPGARNEARD
ncbi:MAG TPA: hypothetical protein VN732_08510 [Solirubrobacterales bacterium]|nr:hypothetical protein [Solirubrobacterales bacterium]